MRLIAGGLAAVALVCAHAGCAASGGWRDQVRLQAAHDHRCPVRAVRIVRDSGEPRHRRVTLEICGRVRVYREVAALAHDGARAPRESQWRPVRRRRHAAAVRTGPERRRADRRPSEPGRSTSASRRRSEPAGATKAASRRRGAGAPTYGSTVRRVVSRATDGACGAARRRMSSTGVLVIVVSIGPRGRVTEAFPEVEQVPAPVSSCMVNRIRDLSFPRPPGGRATFHFPFQLEPTR